ncbi:hypothetical protein LJR175_000825 [Variovorax sp. LjRoot175]|uniref:hypothetical protein n=1 Tax=Variovorax sp. LjRoot175 TaxID=3342276 RepID=UPI003ECC9311
MRLQQIEALAQEAAKYGPDLNVTTDDPDDGWDDDHWEQEDDGRVEVSARRRQAWANARAVQTDLGQQLAAVLEEIKAVDPARYKDLNLQVQLKARPKPVKPAAYQQVIDAILSPYGMRSTQAAIQRQVKEAHPNLSVPKDWTKPLPVWARKKLMRKLGSSGQPFNTITVDQTVTLASLHKKAKRAQLTHSDGTLVVSAKITITADKILIGNEEFRFSTNRVKGYTYQRAQVDRGRLLRAVGQ